jgi:hypothetical protein
MNVDRFLYKVRTAKEDTMLRVFLMAGAALAFSATAGMAGNSTPLEDNYQPFMWGKPQISGEPSTATDLGMEDRVSQPPLLEGRAAYIEHRALARRPLHHNKPIQ